MKRSVFAKCAMAGAVCALAATTSNAAFTITVNYASGTNPTADQQQAFNNAKSFWEEIIRDYKPGVNNGTGTDLTGITIVARIETIDGPNGVLGSAGPSLGQDRAGNFYATNGNMRFDIEDVGTNFSQVVLHEMAHVIGFGTLWVLNNIYVDGTGAYTGVNALAAYRTEYAQPLATSVPVELAGGSGTANGHWDENTGGIGATGIVDRQGRDKQFELMTGWLNTPSYVSVTTIQQFRDLGYLTQVPEPAAAMVVGPLALALRRRRR